MDDIPIPTAKPLFDEQPIGNPNKVIMSEYPEGYDPTTIVQPAKPQPLPLAKRIASKVFKVKKQAMEQLLKIVTNDNHKQFLQHQTKIIQGISDSNPQCQILAAKILLQYLNKEGSYQNVIREEAKKSFPKQVIQKLLIIQREQAQSVGMEILFWLMDHQHDQYLLNELNDYLLNKNPKIVAVTFKILQSLVHNYGVKKLDNLERFFKNLKLLADPIKPTAKKETIDFFQELFKWMGDSMFIQFVIHADCKDEVMKWSKKYEKEPMEIKRGLKKGEAAKKVMPDQQDDSEEIVPVDVLPQYDSRWVDTIFELVKWQEKKDLLDEFIKKTNIKSIVPRETSHYITLLKRLFQDNNINLLLCGYKIVKNLCRGLKKSFSIPSKCILPYIYIKLKDNKQLIVDQTLATLKAMTASITIEDLEKQIVQAMRDKSPQMRLNTLHLLKEVTTKKQPKTSKILKSMLSTLVSLTNDSSSDVRDAALAVLCKIKEQHGMIFFQDKLESLPAKKLNTIRSTPTVGSIPQTSMIPENTQNSSNTFQRSNTINAPIKNNIQNNGGKKLAPDNKIGQQNNKRANLHHPQAQTSNTSRNIIKNPEKSLEKKPLYTMDTKQKRFQMEIANHKLPVIHEQHHFNQNTLRQAQQRQMMEIRQQEWPIVPHKEHVHRLIKLFTKLGEPFATLATPFRLTFKQVQMLENAENSFINDNADLILKWALWKIQTQKPQIIDKITSIVIHLIFVVKNQMNDSLTVLFMSIIANLLESDFTNFQMLQCINTSIMEISENLREKVLNFWLKMLNDSDGNPSFCDKILNLLKATYANIEIHNNEIVSMARVDPIVKSRSFIAFLETKKQRSFLKVSGFKIVEDFKSFAKQSEWLLRQTEMDFDIEIRIEERVYFVDIFKKISNEATDEFIKIQTQCSMSEIIGVNIKIMDSVMLPFLDQNLQPINMHNYLARLTGILTKLNESFITPHLKNLLRLVMFFIIDLSGSRLDDKDQLTKATNKIILIIIDKVPAEHILESTSMLLTYCLQKNLTKRLSQILTKCMVRATKNSSFNNKAHKNVKFMFNYIISFVQRFKIPDNDPIMKTFVEIFANMTIQYKELCYQNVIEKLQYFRTNYEGNFISQTIVDIFNRFMNRPEQEQSLGMNEAIRNQGGRIMQNNPFMSNLPQNYSTRINSIDPNQQAYMEIRAPNIPRKDGDLKPISNPSNVDLIQNEGPRIKEDRRRVQDYTGLCQSFVELTKIQDKFNLPPQIRNNNVNEKSKGSQQQNENGMNP